MIRKTFFYCLAFVLFFSLSYNVSAAKSHLNNYKISDLQLKIYPNPSNEAIIINAKILGYDNECPITIKFYTISGKLVKSFIINNGIETLININALQSGSYLIYAESEFINNKGFPTQVSVSDIIIIQK